MKRDLNWLALLLLIVSPGCRNETNGEHLALNRYSKCHVTEGHKLVCRPSVAELIVRPEWYDAKAVMVSGVFQYGSEGVNLFASEEAYQYRLSESSVRLELSQGACTGVDCRTLDGKWVMLQGRFAPPNQRATTQTGGAIVDVTDLILRAPGLPGAVHVAPRVVPGVPAPGRDDAPRK
jgi:hypothetical protein